MNTIVVINGMPRSGKDLFVELCKNVAIGDDVMRENILNISSIDFVKEIARQCGWDGTKTPENRKFLADLKKLLTEWNNVPTVKIVDEILDWQLVHDNGIVFVHIREPEEIKKFVDICKDLGWMKVATLLIRRPDIEDQIILNDADKDVFDYKYNYLIWNDSTIDQFAAAAHDFVYELIKV